MIDNVAESDARSGAAAVAATAAYEGTATHHRGCPSRTFAPRLFLAYLDVDALPSSIDPLPLWSARPFSPVQYRRRDFFDSGARPLGDAVRELVAERLGRRPKGRIFLLAHLRTFGWLFNPLSVYYCWTADGSALDAVVLEVSNTPWGERVWYVLDARDPQAGAVMPKVMHVSPFLPMDVDYHVVWTTPGAELKLRIDVRRKGETLFSAELALRRVELDRSNALRLLLRYPLLPLRVSAAIHWQAFLILCARAPGFRHPTRRNPHRGVPT